MADEVFKVGTLQTTAEAALGFLFQATNPKVVAKKDEGPDHRGNLKVWQFFDHRLEVDIEAILPRAAGVPVPGQTVSLTGVQVPTFSADGTVTAGTFEVADEDSGSGAGTALEMVIDTESEIIMQNDKITRVKFKAVRGLENEVPVAGSAP